MIVSNDLANKYLNRVQVIPLTTSVDRVYPSEAVIIVNEQQAKALADQLTTVSKLRLGNKMGVVTARHMQKIEQIIKVQLGFVA